MLILLVLSSWGTMFTGLNQEEHEIHFNETVEDIHFYGKQIIF